MNQWIAPKSAFELQYPIFFFFFFVKSTMNPTFAYFFNIAHLTLLWSSRHSWPSATRELTLRKLVFFHKQFHTETQLYEREMSLWIICPQVAMNTQGSVSPRRKDRMFAEDSEGDPAWHGHMIDATTDWMFVSQLIALQTWRDNCLRVGSSCFSLARATTPVTAESCSGALMF